MSTISCGPRPVAAAPPPSSSGPDPDKVASHGVIKGGGRFGSHLLVFGACVYEDLTMTQVDAAN